MEPIQEMGEVAELQAQEEMAASHEAANEDSRSYKSGSMSRFFLLGTNEQIQADDADLKKEKEYDQLESKDMNDAYEDLCNPLNIMLKMSSWMVHTFAPTCARSWFPKVLELCLLCYLAILFSGVAYCSWTYWHADNYHPYPEQQVVPMIHKYEFSMGLFPALLTFHYLSLGVAAVLHVHVAQDRLKEYIGEHGPMKRVRV